MKRERQEEFLGLPLPFGKSGYAVRSSGNRDNSLAGHRSRKITFPGIAQDRGQTLDVSSESLHVKCGKMHAIPPGGGWADGAGSTHLEAVLLQIAAVGGTCV